MKPTLLLAALAAGLCLVHPPAWAADARPDVAGPAPLDAARQRSLYLDVIEGLRKQGSAGAALAHLDAYDRQYPHDPRAEIVRADCLADIGKDADAEALYRKALGGALADQAQAGLGHLFAGRGDWTAAADAFAEAVRRRPTEVGYLNDLGYAMVRSGRTGEGLFRLRQALELSPGDVLVRNNLIVALKAAGRTGDAEAVIAAIKAPAEQFAARAVFAQAKAQGETP